jgi:hypothetical protein
LLGGQPGQVVLEGAGAAGPAHEAGGLSGGMPPQG